MLKSYFTIAVRTLLKNKAFTAINILGLSIGISASLVIYLLTNYHFTFDKFEKDGDRIYRVVSNFNFSGEVYRNSGVCDPMGSGVRRELTGLDAVISIRTWDGNAKISVPVAGKNDPIVFKNQKNIVFADSNYFNLTGYRWLSGSSGISLNKPYQVVLTESNAKLYFPNFNAVQVIGKEIYLNDTVRVTVTGIVKDIPENTDFSFKTFVSHTTLENTSLKPDTWDSWDNTNGAQQLFVKVAAGTAPAQIEKQIAGLYKKYHKQEPGDKSKIWHSLQPLSNLHFNADYGGYALPIAHKPTLYGLLAVAAFLLMLGCINFINLTTAQAAQRAKEIGIRKTMGSSRKQLIVQFLSETFLLTLSATLLSIILTPLILKAFAGFIPEGLHFNLTQQPGVIVFLSLLMLVVTILSGFYPALVLSGYKPVLVLKNQAYSNSGKTRHAWLRKSLTISQFGIAQVFIMGAILVSKQITYSLNKDLGFKKEAILYVQTNYYDTVKNHKYILRDKLKAIPEIAMVSLCSYPPSSGSTWSGTMKYKDGKTEIETDVQQKFGDTNYIKLYKLKLLAGKNFEQTDTVKSFIINETYARTLGFQQPQQAIGKQLEWGNRQVPVAGVVADFHQKSLHESIKPLVIASWDNTERSISVALQPQQPGHTTWKTAISKIEKAWKEVYPQDDFDYSFFDKDIAKFYESEQHISGLLMWATGLAILISCLGLLGLVIYTTTQRTKEIGVRKVLGASIAQIVAMISKEFILLVILAFLIAAPLAWMGMHQWLQNFAYRTDISLWIFLTAALMMIGIALLTLAFQTIKAAMANPVKSLRME
ncbi:MAG: FtsX-like permease family protein [Chitinophagaceae bacterium]|nr:FtsX-like permease family protein [Chitinophagaceae bacterium]